MVEENRPKKQRTYIKRTQVKKKDDTKDTKNNKETIDDKKTKSRKQQLPDDSDEELPKYKS
jgi:hypothetical protein